MFHVHFFPSLCKHSNFHLFLWAASFDLHVLGMPPAFILSQDQTLQKNLFFRSFELVYFFVLPSFSNYLTFCSVFRDHSLFAFLFLQTAPLIYQILFSLSTHFFTFFYLFLFYPFFLFFSSFFFLFFHYQNKKSLANFLNFYIIF